MRQREVPRTRHSSAKIRIVQQRAATSAIAERSCYIIAVAQVVVTCIERLGCMYSMQSRPVSAWSTAITTRIRRRSVAREYVSSIVAVRVLVAAQPPASVASRGR